MDVGMLELTVRSNSIKSSGLARIFHTTVPPRIRLILVSRGGRIKSTRRISGWIPNFGRTSPNPRSINVAGSHLAKLSQT